MNVQTHELSQEHCEIHRQRYCPEPSCCIRLAPQGLAAQTGEGIEASLISEGAAVPAAPALPLQPPTPSVTQTTAVQPAPASLKMTPLQRESPAQALVEASKQYADAAAAAEKAASFVNELTKRLDFAREDTAEAVLARDAALKKVREIVSEKSERLS